MTPWSDGFCRSIIPKKTFGLEAELGCLLEQLATDHQTRPGPRHFSGCSIRNTDRSLRLHFRVNVVDLYQGKHGQNVLYIGE
jgi:hypothetical protein